MANDYYSSTSLSQHTSGTSAGINTERAAVEAAFDKLPSEATMNGMNWDFGTDTGAADLYTVTLTDTDTSLADGMRVCMKVGAGNTNTGACTLDLNEYGARSIKLITGNDPAAGDLTAGDLIEMRYDLDNTRWVITSPVRSMF